MNFRNSLAGAMTALAVVAMAASPVAASSSKSNYCASKARNVANNRALGSTVIGAGAGCLLGALIAHKCGVGAAVGGVGGFAVGSAKWKQIYNNTYANCMKS